MPIVCAGKNLMSDDIIASIREEVLRNGNTESLGMICFGPQRGNEIIYLRTFDYSASLLGHCKDGSENDAPLDLTTKQLSDEGSNPV